MKLKILPHWLIFSLLIFSIGNAEKSKLKTYGYFDMEVEYSNKDAAGKIWTFDQHHLNLINIYKIDQRIRLYTEVEYEHGPAISDDGSQGELYLANAYMEYKHSDALKIRIGKFVTPFGIYNERHDATPTFISTKLSHTLYGKHISTTGGESRFFSKSCSGIQILGNLFYGDWGGKYQFYLSNGRGAKPSEQDDNSNKGVGARIDISPPINGLRFGASYYTDENGLLSDIRQSSLAFDLEIDFDNLHLESEMILTRQEKVDLFDIPTGVFRKSFGAYIQTSYKMFDRLTPFVRYEFEQHDLDTDGVNINMLMVGLNYSVTSQVYLKNEIHIHNIGAVKEPGFEMYVGSIAVAF